MSKTNRFAKYDRGDLAPLVKLDEGESFTGRLTGEHEYEGTDGPVPVLEFVDEDGRELNWRASAWHAIRELSRVDPPTGSVVRVTRLPDDGRSHQYSITVVEQPLEQPRGGWNEDGEPIQF